jgi:hypothetical protein
MNIKDFLLTINDETKTIISNDFNVELTKAYVLPSTDDQGLTFENFDNKSKKAKVIETCVLHIDLRHSKSWSGFSGHPNPFYKGLSHKLCKFKFH